MSPHPESRNLARACDGFVRLASWAHSPLLLLLRGYWGWLFMMHGWAKLHDLAHVAQFFTTLGIPAPAAMAPFIASVEFFGGLLLILGLVSRLAGLMLAGDMTVALLTAHRAALLSMFSDADKFVTQAPVTFLIVSMIVLIFGPGKYALDRLLFRSRPEQPSREVIERRLEAAVHSDAA